MEHAQSEVTVERALGTKDPYAIPGSYWSVPATELYSALGSTEAGLTTAEAQRRQRVYGLNALRPRTRTHDLALLLGQFKSPIVLTLLFATILSFLLHDRTDALIILLIVVASGLLSFWHERGATQAVDKLIAMVRTRCAVLRDGEELQVDTEEVVPGDVVLLSAGAMVPGDGLLLSSRDLFVNEATLTGETFPAEKVVGTRPPETPPAGRTNCVFMGSSVISGQAKLLVAQTARQTEFGKISEGLHLRPPETDFERGIRRFGFLLTEVTLSLVILIFAFNVYFHRPVLDSFLFALALAVGLTPQLLPAIISINLAHGARRMSGQKVIVKRLSSIENLGSMNVLCSDKTGTLTEGVVHVHAAVDPRGQPFAKVGQYAYLNATFETGFANPIDDAVRASLSFDLSGYQKHDEIPYDFTRKRLSVLVDTPGGRLLITKGAMNNVLAICGEAETCEGERLPLESLRTEIDGQYQAFSAQGYRTLGVASRPLPSATRIQTEDETGLVFTGFLVLRDPPKESAPEAVSQLRRLGVAFRVITGDNHLVARNVGEQLGMDNPVIVTGSDLRAMSDEALCRQVRSVDLFAEVEPNQKERIILALKKAGAVVGFMGDGINDASALHAADVGISVDSAVDVAKAAADIVLLEKGLDVLADGVREGRMTFANTMKYIFMATSANFGNMFSMAGASLLLPFLPLLPKQILLTNMMTDFPEMAIASDSVDPEMIGSPQRWDLRFIRNFMLTFGLVSSVFDFLTFGVLLFVLQASTQQFRTGWFVESVVSACLVVLVIRSRKPFFRSRPSRLLIVATAGAITLTALLPYSPVARFLGFTPLPPLFLLILAAIVALYFGTAEVVKRKFYAHAKL